MWLSSKKFSLFVVLLSLVSLVANAQSLIFKNSFESIAPVVYDSYPGWSGQILTPYGDGDLIEVLGQVFSVPEDQSDLQSFSFALVHLEGDTSNQPLYFTGNIMKWGGDRATGPLLFKSDLAVLTPDSNGFQLYDFATSGLLLDPDSLYVAFANASTENWDSNPTLAGVGFQANDLIPGGGAWYIDIDQNSSLLTASPWDGSLSTGDLLTEMHFSPPTVLNGLQLSNAVIAPQFQPSQFDYSASVSATETTTTVTATTSAGGATISINGQLVDSGEPSAPIALNLGTTDIEVTLTSQNGKSILAYKIVVSRESYTVSVPNVVGQGQPVAQVVLGLEDLVTGNVTQISSDTIPAGKIISQNPVAGVEVPVGSSVDLGVSAGLPFVTVPAVVGADQSVAQTDILNTGLVVGFVTGIESDTAPIGEVINQSPAGGAGVSPGTEVDLGVSVGINGLVVPNLVGMLQANAEQEILNASLTIGSVSFANSNAVPTGVVLDQSPVAASLSANNWPVDFVVSSGIGRSISYAGPDPVDTTFLSQFPVNTETGLPIIFSLEGIGLMIDIDEKNPLTGMGRCLEWVVSCVDLETGREMDDCARSAPVCSSAEPWLESEACCASACYTQYSTQRLAGSEPLDAFGDVYLSDASCYPGVSEFLE